MFVTALACLLYERLVDHFLFFGFLFDDALRLFLRYDKRLSGRQAGPETLHASGRVNYFIGTGIERVAGTANLHFYMVKG